LGYLSQRRIDVGLRPGTFRHPPSSFDGETLGRLHDLGGNLGPSSPIIRTPNPLPPPRNMREQ
jgi:hypothetical protein